ncbi:uncharacterized protein K02A2.6-like [Actinia tenebrosa]|uniref:Uncharacterized protein K02A2.6-like n=1 Tax=Actinia tenebrosa TaxID=6105 RepID=A0A6P8JF03_ACTTE|nr:uncharacterized protein K02A2.6-like [Actinia tenebrosa]
MAKELEFGSIKPFDSSGDPTSVAPRWKRWKRSFEYFIVGKGVKDDDQKQALLPHCAGESVQTIFEGLDDLEVGEGETKYKKTMKVLDDYFTPKANIPYERHLFRNIKQEISETIDQFVSRLRIQALNCDFGDAIDENIRDQIIDKCNSPQLRTKLLAKGTDLELKETQDMARAMETAQVQARKIEQDFKGEVNVVNTRDERKQKRPSGRPSKMVYYRCGKEGHLSHDLKCPARNATCNKCKKVGHFGKVCKTKTLNQQQQQKPEVKRRNGEKLNEVEKREYNFSINLWDNEHFGGNIITAIIGGVKVDRVLVDSGATCNIIDKETWEYLKKNRVVCTSNKSQKSLYPYGSKTPLKVLGEFKSIVSVNNVEKETDFVVVDTEGRPILGCRTSEDLGVLKINTVNAMTVDDIVREFPECFKGVGKLNNYQAKIHVDPNVKPVAQQYRRLPFSMREKVEVKLEELVNMDIIEEVQGPTPWVSPIVVVPKADGDIRLRVDMRQANTAIIRERYPIPTIDEVLERLNESTLFTKLDLKWGFHQIELEAEPRKITTFATHKGLFQYKRLMFGISSAPEMYQHIIQQVLAGCDGASNIADDIGLCIYCTR